MYILLRIRKGDFFMNNNLNASKLKNMLKSKGFVTAVCALLAVAVLLVGYNIRIKNATNPRLVPVAKYRLTARHQITEDDIEYIKVPAAATEHVDFYSNGANVVGQYVNIDTTIPAGSMFYRSSIVSKDELPDESLLGVGEGETLYYLTVNMLTSYTNSIIPNRYIDIYISTEENGKAVVGKLLTNVKVLQVKTSDGKNVFDDSEESRVPYVIMFSLPEKQHLLLRSITAINNYSIAAGNSNFARIDIIPVPTTAFFKDGDEEVKPTVTSKYLEDMIWALAEEIEVDNIDLNIDFNQPDVKIGE